MSVFGASNELPEQGDGLDAINDRFVMRFLVNPIKDNNNFKQFLLSKAANNGLSMTPIVSGKDLVTLQNMVPQVKVDSSIADTLQTIREELIQADIKDQQTLKNHLLVALKNHLLVVLVNVFAYFRQHSL